MRSATAPPRATIRAYHATGSLIRGIAVSLHQNVYTKFKQRAKTFRARRAQDNTLHKRLNVLPLIEERVDGWFA